MIANTIAVVPFLFVVSLLFSIPVYWIVGLNPSIQAFSFFVLCVWLIILMASSLVLFLSAVSPDFISGNSLICTVLVSLLFSIPVYSIVGLNPSIQAFSFFVLCVWLIILMASSLVLFLSAVSPDFISGNSLICTVLGSFFLFFSGYFIPKEKIAKPWMFMYDVSLYLRERRVLISSRGSYMMANPTAFVPFLFVVCLLFIQPGVSTPVYTIYSSDGDVIDCINRLDQPAFHHPLLRDHLIQEYPTGMLQTRNDEPEIRQVWHATGNSCPAGSIPVRRESGDPSASYRKYNPNANDLAERATSKHKYAIGFMVDRERIYGTRATLNVWDPLVEAYGDFSLAQIWLASGSYEAGDMNTLEAGWQVYPSRYHDHQPRLFTYWTANAYNGTGCYGIDCGGFIQTSSTIAIGAAISRTSTPGSTQLDITIQVSKDPVSGNWWLGLGHDNVPVGYWPASIFTLLSDHATKVEWGGEVLYRNLSGMTTKVQMGSGEYAGKGFRRAAYFCNLKVAENSHMLQPVQDFGVKADYPDYFTVKKVNNSACGNHFYYGGPGPQRSGAVRRVSRVVSLVLSFWFFFSLF